MKDTFIELTKQKKNFLIKLPFGAHFKNLFLTDQRMNGNGSKFPNKGRKYYYYYIIFFIYIY